VGTIAIFWSNGVVHRWVTQGYLIASSVLVAWQLSQFDPWTAWILLVLLAFYDLFAVLTPCGPLKALINVMQKEGAPAMPPGLLFEARVNNNPRATTGRGTRQRTNSSNAKASSVDQVASRKKKDEESPLALTKNEPNEDSNGPDEPYAKHQFELKDWENSRPNEENKGEHDDEEEEKIDESLRTDDESRWRADDPLEVSSDGQELTLQDSMRLRDKSTWPDNDANDEKTNPQATKQSEPQTTPDPTSQAATKNAVRNGTGVTARIPLAIARLYKLKLVDDLNPIWRQRSSNQNTPEATEDGEVPTSASHHHFTVAELQAMVEAIIPTNGGRIEPHETQPMNGEEEEVRYKVTDRHGKIRRIIFVGARDGRIYQEKTRGESSGAKHDPRHERIRLGLGDFVFYSVLVALASMQSFVSFAACFLVILAGLLVTLLVLAMTKHALPALPISIFLAVIAFLLTQLVVEDWIQYVHLEGMYV